MDTDKRQQELVDELDGLRRDDPQYKDFYKAWDKYTKYLDNQMSKMHTSTENSIRVYRKRIDKTIKLAKEIEKLWGSK
jgi:hypothetical protein